MSDLFSGSRKALAEKLLATAVSAHPVLTFRAPQVDEMIIIRTPRFAPIGCDPPRKGASAARPAANYTSQFCLYSRLSLYLC